MNILAIPGSLRTGSINRALLEAAAELAPAGVNITIRPLNSLPFYNGDVDHDGQRPAEVEAFASALREADAVLIATPEYNHVVPGVLANAIDWGSRPLGGTVPLHQKPVAVIGASPGMLGTARAQDHLKFVLFHLGARVLPASVVVGGARGKFDQDGRLTDPETRRRIAKLLATLAEFVGVQALAA
jgi:chromate reductase, NAD(P)H dehydrogenase (quinone)